MILAVYNGHIASTQIDKQNLLSIGTFVSSVVLKYNIGMQKRGFCKVLNFLYMLLFEEMEQNDQNHKT